MSFNKNLKYYRLKKLMSKKDLAKKTGLRVSTISEYENGTKIPSMENLRRLSEVLEVNVSDFLIARRTDLTFEHGRIYCK